MTSDQRELDRRAAGRRGLRGDQGLRWFTALAAGWLVGYAVALGTTNGSTTGRLVVQSGLYPVPIALATVWTAAAARRAAGRDRVFWAAMAAFSGLWLAGETVWAVQAAAGTLPAWGGWLATALYLMSYAPALVTAMFNWGVPPFAGGPWPVRHRRRRLAVAYLGLELTVRPALSSQLHRGGS